MKAMNFLETLGLACGDGSFRDELAKDGFQAASHRGAKVTKDGEAFFDEFKGAKKSQDAVDVLKAMETIEIAGKRLCKAFPRC